MLLAAALLPMPWPIVVADVGFFGFAAVVLLVAPLSRALAFRVDAAGVTLGRSFPRILESRVFVPWDEVAALHVAVEPWGRPATPFVYVVLPDGRIAGSRPIVMWTLDLVALREVLADVAPEVGLVGSLPARESSSRMRLRTPRNPRFRFFWYYLAPVGIGCLIYLVAGHVGPSWSAHLGRGRLGTWTVAQTSCSGEKDCTPLGDFVASDGTDLRVNIQMAHGSPPIPAVGGSLQAVDTGDPDRVYPIGGGYSWVVYTLVMAGLIPLALLWIWTVPIRRLVLTSSRR
ncbi:MAG TPA: hypothetical protein VL551_15025 [Actinospica sp.]|jgi:hypothetical protein|nr:hypothetical protein [Actinospica sp.]